MGNVVTVAANREFLVYAGRMRQIMTATALRDRFVLVGMTGCTADIMVLGLSCCKQLGGAVVTGCAENVGRAVRIGDNQWLVSLVTAATVRLGHVF